MTRSSASFFLLLGGCAVATTTSAPEQPVIPAGKADAVECTFESAIAAAYGAPFELARLELVTSRGTYAASGDLAELRATLVREGFAAARYEAADGAALVELDTEADLSPLWQALQVDDPAQFTRLAAQLVATHARVRGNAELDAGLLVLFAQALSIWPEAQRETLLAALDVLSTSLEGVTYLEHTDEAIPETLRTVSLPDGEFTFHYIAERGLDLQLAIEQTAPTGHTEIVALPDAASCDHTRRLGKLLFVDAPATFDRAIADCRARGGELATHRVYFDTALLRVVMGDASPAWIGISDRRVEGQFERLDGGALDDTAFAPGEPADARGDQDCLAIVDYDATYGWSDERCASLLPYVCELR